MVVNLARDGCQNPDISKIIEQYERYINPFLIKTNRMLGFDTAAQSARGSYILDMKNKLFLDCTSGFGVCPLGHGNSRIIQAVKNQMDKITFSSQAMLDIPAGELAERLARITPGELQYSCITSSGYQAMDTALKIARLARRKDAIIRPANSRNAETIGAVSGRISPSDMECQWINPYVTLVPYGQLEAVKEAITPNTAGIIVEPIQVEEGIILPPYGYLNGLRKICDNNNILLIANEAQTGLGRTGYMFGCELEDVTPDILVLAESLGGGVMPIGSVTAKPYVWEALINEPEFSISAIGGNPLSCSAASAALDFLMETRTVYEVRDKGDYLLRHLQTFLRIYPSVVKNVRGRGLIIGIELIDQRAAGVVLTQLLEQNILTAFAQNNNRVIKFQPPFIITYQELDYLIAAMEKAIKYAEEFLE